MSRYIIGRIQYSEIRHTVMFVSVLAVFIFCTCCRYTATILYPQELITIDSLCKYNPDRALSRLDNIECDTLKMSDGAKAYYHLLSVKVRDKLYIPIASNKEILKSVSVFHEIGDKEKEAWACFYVGRIYRNMQRNSMAIDFFHRACDLQPDNNMIQKASYEQIAYLLRGQSMYKLALSAFRKTYEYNVYDDDTIGIIYNLRDIAGIYDVQKNFHKADSLYTKALNLAILVNDSLLIGRIKSQMASLYQHMGKQNKAKNILDEIGIYKDSADMGARLYILTKYFSFVHNVDSSKFYLNQLAEYGNISEKAYSYKELAKFYLSYDVHKSSVLLDKADSLENILENAGSIEQATISQMNFMYEHENKKSNVIYSIVVFSILCLVLLMYFIYGTKKGKKETCIDSDIAHKILSSSEPMKMSEECWNSLSDYINNTYPGFMENTLVKGNLSAKEYRICMLIKIKTPLTKIAGMMFVSKSAITNARTSMYSKMFQIKGKARDFDDYIASL